MATKLQDLQAKRKELQATNQNATMLDAKLALSPAPIANAPVAWQAPAITPIAPAPVVTEPVLDNKAIAEQNKANVQSEIQAGTRPEVWQQPVATPPAPIAPAPVAPAPVTQTQATVAPVTPTPEVKTPKEPKPTEVVQPPATVQGIFTALATKADIPDAQKALPSYKIAQNRFTKANMYSSMTPAQLAQDVNDAKIVEWSPAWEDIKMLNPKLVKDVQNLNTVNGTKSNIFTYVNNPDGTKTKENNLVKTFASDYNDNYWDIVKVLKGIYGQDTAEEARARIHTPEVKQAEDRATEYELKMIAKLDEMAMIDKDVEKEMAWTGATWSRIALEKSYRNEQLQNQYNSLQKTYTAFANKANNLITQNTELYDKEREQKAQLNQALAWIAVKWYEAQQAEKIAKATLNDPTKAIPALIEQYTKLGVPMQRSVQEMIAEAQNEIANGWTLASYLTKLQQTIQSKPEYKRIQEMQQGQMTDFEKMQASQSFELGKMWMEQDFQMALANAKNVTSWKLTKLDDWLYQDESWNVYTGDEIKNAKLLGNSYITKQVGEEGGECGFYASRATGLGSTPWGNSKEARTKAFSETTPQVWGMVFFGGAWYDPTYGHISIVTSVNQDGTITVKDSNYSNDKKVQERTVPASTATGFYNNTPLASGLNSSGTQTNWQYSDEQINNLAYLVELQEKNPSEASKQMKEMWYKAQDMANYKAGNMPLTDKQKNSSTEVMDAIKQLADTTKYEWNDAVGFLAGTPSFAGWDAETATMAIDNLVAKLTLPNLWVLKWPMSDKDIQFIKEASSKLSRNQSDASFERNLIDAYNLSARRAWLPGIKKLSELQWAPQETAGWEKSYSKYEN